MENLGELLINVVRTNEPKALIGLNQKVNGWYKSFPLLLSQTLQPSANRQLLTHSLVHKWNVVSPPSTHEGKQTVRQADGTTGKGGWKKPMPSCNEMDRS